MPSASKLKIHEGLRVIRAPPHAEHQHEEDARKVHRPAAPDFLLQQLVQYVDFPVLQPVCHQQHQQREQQQVELLLAQSEAVDRVVEEDPRVVHREDALYHVQRIMHPVCPEEDPREVHQHERHGCPQHAVPKAVLLHLQSPASLLLQGFQHAPDYLERAVEPSPDHEGPLRTVPQPAHQEDDHDVHVLARRALAVATQRDVQVVAEPRRQRDVPPPPELRHRLREVRAVEILHQLEPHHLRRPHGNRRIAAEVAVYLHGEQHARQKVLAPLVPVHIPIDRVHQERDPVRNDDLLEVPPEHQEEPPAHVLIREGSFPANLPQEVLRALNRPCDKLGEERHEQRILEEVPLHVDFLPVHVHRVAQRLEDVEGDPHRQKQVKPGLQQLHPEPGEDEVDVFDCKMEILEQEQHRQVQDEAHRHKDPLPAFPLRLAVAPVYQKPAQVGDRRRVQEQQGILCIPAHVEEIACHEEPQIADFFRHHEVNEHHNGEKTNKLY